MKKREVKYIDKRADKLQKHAKKSSDEEDGEAEESGADSWSGEKKSNKTK